MKILLPILIIMLIFGANGALILFTVNKILVSPALAEEYTPFDFGSDYESFAVTVGINKTEGRYATYHYEFSE